MAVDKLQAIQLKQTGATYKQIAKLQKVTPQAVCKAIKHLLPNELTEIFKDKRADIFAEFQRQLLTSVDKGKIKNMSGSAAILASCQLYDKERIERGLSDNNTRPLVMIQINQDGKSVSTAIPSVDTDINIVDTSKDTE